MNQSVEGKGKEQKDNEEYSKNFARIPNMLFTSFKHLSKEEKFLYCTLKCIYWDGKQRYVSLRDLGELTGYSAGALSKMLPHLRKCGLVSAEIRRELGKDGREKGNPKYQVTILDIWELNRHYYSCSPNERDLLDPSIKLVQEMNELVAENTQARSPNDTNLLPKSDKAVSFGQQVYAQVEHAKDKKDLIKTSRKKEGRETPSVTPSPPAALSPSSQISTQKKTAQIVHPLHSFLLLDDAIAPTTLTVMLTSKEYESELEDDRRMRIAQEVQWDLAERGHEVECMTVREHEQRTIDAPAARPHLLESLTDAQADFWQRWRAISGCDDAALTEKQLPDVVDLAEKIATTTDLESLYQSASAMLLDYTKAQGTPFTPPHLRNLAKHYTVWKAAQDAKQKQREQTSQKAIPGTGKVQNWTAARLAGKVDAQPLQYISLDKPKSRPARTL